MKTLISRSIFEGYRVSMRQTVFAARLAATGIIATLLSPLAQAQTIDYGALEQLFGEPVTTSATGSPQRASEVPANMEIITADEIRRSGADDIPGILQHVSGIDILRWASDGADVGVRGYNQAQSPRLLVLIDGRQVYADHYGYTPWGALPVELDAIRQIEVVKGPNSALFGFNAVGGVINIITSNPLYDDVNAASLTGGTQGLGGASAVTSFKFGDYLGVRIEAGGQRDDDFSTAIPQAVFSAPRRTNSRNSFDIDGVLRLSDDLQFSLEGSRTDAAVNSMNGGYNFDFFRFNTSSIKGQLSGDTDFGLLQATAYTNWIKQEDEITSLNTPFLFDNQVTVVQIEDVFKLGSDHTLRATVEYRHNSETTTPVAGANIFYDVFSAGGMWDWKITPSLSWTNALRLDHLTLGRDGYTPPGYPFTNADWNRSSIQYSANSGLVWKADERDTFRFILSRGVQIPSLVNDGAILLQTPFFSVTGVPNLSPTIVASQEIDWDHALPSLGANFSASMFHERTDDVISLQGGVIQGASVPFLTPTNVEDSIASGLELGLRGGGFDGWRWGVTYRFEIVTDHFIEGLRNGVDFVDFQHTTPVHVAGANLGWAHGPWEIDGYLRYQSSSYGLVPTVTGTALTPIAEYVSVDARVAYKVTDWATLSLSGQNLTQASQRQTSGPNVERRILGTFSVKY